MRAIIFNKKLEYITDYPKPSLEKGWAIVKVLKAGICNTDLEIIKGYMEFNGILGHEFVGIVEECTDSAWLGKRVTGEINFACSNVNGVDRNLADTARTEQLLAFLKLTAVWPIIVKFL